MLWHGESGAERGGDHATIGCRGDNRFGRAARGSGAAGAYPFHPAAVGLACPDDPAGSGQCGRTPGSWMYGRRPSDIGGNDGGRLRTDNRVPGGLPMRHARELRPPFTPEEICAVVSMTCEKPSDGERPISRAPAGDCRRGDATRYRQEDLAALSGALFKKETDLKPHRVRYWLTPKPDPAFDAKCGDYLRGLQGRRGRRRHSRTISIDEMTGIQALERIAPGLPMLPGKVERREFEYRRHDTQTLIAAFNVTTRNTRTEKDFTRFLRRVLSTAPTARWDIVCENLNIHLSEISRPAGGPGSATLGQARRQRQVRCAGFEGHSHCLPRQEAPSRHLPLHAPSRLMAQPNRDLVLDPRPQPPSPRPLHLQRRICVPRSSSSSLTSTLPWQSPSGWTMAEKPLTG